MIDSQPTLFVVDDDPGVSRALESVGRLLDLHVMPFTSAHQFLEADVAGQPGCLVLDIKMPGVTGLELQQQLVAKNVCLPVIVLSGYVDVRIAVEAMNRGAVTVLEKPCHLDEMTDCIRRAIKIDAERRADRDRKAHAHSRIARLTDKEREVLELILAGKTNKTIAVRLGLSVRAIEDRRSRLMKKLGTRTLVELVNAAAS